MKQRLGIAAAVMEKPDIVLLDEPTNALDESGLSMLRACVEAEIAWGGCGDSKPCSIMKKGLEAFVASRP